MTVMRTAVANTAMSKTIMEQMAEITAMTKKMEADMENLVITPNKIWIPNKGLVTLWEVKQNA